MMHVCLQSVIKLKYAQYHPLMELLAVMTWTTHEKKCGSVTSVMVAKIQLRTTGYADH